MNILNLHQQNSLGEYKRNVEVKDLNLIICDQHCQHQQEGYCTLNYISSITNDSGAKCGYYLEQDKVGRTETASAPHYGDRL